MKLPPVKSLTMEGIPAIAIEKSSDQVSIGAVTLGTDDDKGMLAENMEKLSEITDQMTEEMTGDLTENIEALPTEKAPEETAEKELSGQKLSTKELSTEEKLQQDAIEKKAYHPFDMRA